MMCTVTLDEVMVCLVGLQSIWKLVLSYAPVEGWVINLDVHGLSDCPGGAMCLPAYDGAAVHIDRMSHGLAVLADGRGDS